MDINEAMEKAKAVERGEAPSGDVILKITGPNSLHSPGPDPTPEGQRDQYLMVALDKRIGQARERVKYPASTDTKWTLELLGYLADEAEAAQVRIQQAGLTITHVFPNEAVNAALTLTFTAGGQGIAEEIAEKVTAELVRLAGTLQVPAARIDAENKEND